jgi:hypothetical protein
LLSAAGRLPVLVNAQLDYFMQNDNDPKHRDKLTTFVKHADYSPTPLSHEAAG